MEKLKMHSPDMTQENIDRIRDLFPNCVTEIQDEAGNLKLALDFDQLKQELSDSIVEGPQERYQLNWPGKRSALLTSNAPIAKTLRPCREESVNFDTTKNLFIEGDNLDALKLLQETYLGKVKMIYIDPPYNTGHDFVYADNFAENANKYLQKSNQEDTEGNRLVSNAETKGRFHSVWLSMMYPRLKLARNILSEDGAIFISIDDNEVENLRKMCNEIFGDENFIASFIWKRRASSAMADNNVSADHEYVLCYQKGGISGFRGIPKDFKKYSNPDGDSRGPWVLGDLTVGMTASMRPNQAYDLIDPESGAKYKFNPNRVWAYIPESMDRMIAEGRVVFPADESKRPMQKRFKNELKSLNNPLSTILIDKVGLNTEATRQIQKLFGGNVFDYSKPMSLINVLMKQLCGKEDIVLDFFAGSAVTAHVAMELNKEDMVGRKFIMVQLPENTNKKSEAYKAGFETVADIGKERLRRAGIKLLEEVKDQTGSSQNDELFSSSDSTSQKELDIGFRVLKIDTSNMSDIYYNPDEADQKKVDLFTENIKPDRTSEDILFQVLLDWGVDLGLHISRETVNKLEVFRVDTNALIACFAKKGEITEQFCKALAKDKPLRVVFRDAGFKSDSVKINVEQIFKQLSPSTEVRTI